MRPLLACRWPAEDALRDWLISPDVIRPNGDVLSWASQTHPGYAYPEVAGLLLSLLTNDGADRLRLRRCIALAAVARIHEDGGVGRGGRSYVFDTAMLLRGLVDHLRSGGGVPDESVLAHLFRFVAEGVVARRPVTPGDASGHWSASFTPHLLKVLLAVQAWRQWRGDRGAAKVATRLRRELAPLRHDGRFAATDGNGWSYVHACCYAVEGLLFSGTLRAPFAEAVAAAELLSRAQRADGSLPAWLEGTEGRGPSRTDATAQAVRLWCRLDPVRWEASIDYGLRFLGRMQHPCGGILYEERSADVNTWATIFTLQALRWAHDGWRGEQVI
jgi:hypothetical protein